MKKRWMWCPSCGDRYDHNEISGEWVCENCGKTNRLGPAFVAVKDIGEKYADEQTSEQT